MAKIYLIEGAVGSGKSTYARALSEKNNIVHISLDDWMARLFSPDRPVTNTMQWYVERKWRCIDQIWQVASAMLATDNDVILELGLIQRKSRDQFYQYADDTEIDIHMHVLDVPKEVRRERVHKRNIEQGATYSMDVPDDIFEMASNMWETPDDIECCERDIQIFDY